ncbi:hypothetical protein [Singulisphaera acidiphila]|uniref:HEAT repeat protein n=1 Tax=Singulisphaera acidiphila (strain ATCC BAA-1392 / DSM 18658 / VKM B-2454 / MOB10) TaxID=886293 RepID=L0D6A3_SINAD|nr:hypothetical protein [Singulisphaera acidiphila]AGA24792.1 hypothetical protein Sinac_0351 [Singulisphaera acidiphila DSM 18658]
MEEEFDTEGERNRNSQDHILKDILANREINLLKTRIKGMKATISNLMKESEEALQKQISLKSKFEEYAGECLERLQNEHRFALQLLNNKSASLRWAAIYALRVHWLSAITEQDSITLANIAEFDTDSEVRWIAIYTIGCYYKGTNNLQICKFLKNIMHLESKFDDIRERAKDSIWLINYGRISI